MKHINEYSDFKKSLNEGPGKGYYIKVAVRDAKKALSILDDMYRKKFDISGSDTYYFKDEDIAYDAKMDLAARDIQVTDTNIEESVTEAMNKSNTLAKDVLRDATDALTKTMGSRKLDKKYIKDYLKSIEQMARKSPSELVKDYGDFDINDWLEDVKYNLQNEGKLTEAEDYKYKKYVSKAFDKISDAMFEFRNAMGVKQLGQADPKLKKRIEAMQAEIFALRRDMKSEGLTESEVNEAMDMNDPILVAIRARKTMLAKEKAAPKVKKISIAQYYKLMDKESDLISQIKDAAKDYEQLDSDMNQEAGQKGADWSDADANRYGGDLDKLQTKVEKLTAKRQKVRDAIKNYRMS